MIVTGASRGIGAAIAEKVAGDGYGVIVNYAAGAELVNNAGTRGERPRIDEQDADELSRLAVRQARRLGRT